MFRYLPRGNKKTELSVFTKSGHVVYVSIYRLSDCRSNDSPFREICIRDEVDRKAAG